MQGARKQSLRIITGAVVPIYTALEGAIQKHRTSLTKAESQLRVVRVTLTDDGTKRVGLRFPTQAAVLQDLQVAIAEMTAYVGVVCFEFVFVGVDRCVNA